MIVQIARRVLASLLLVSTAAAQAELILPEPLETSPRIRASLDNLLRQYARTHSDSYLHELVRWNNGAGLGLSLGAPTTLGVPGWNQGVTYESFIMRSHLVTPQPFPLESYFISVPVPHPPGPQPLLVIFHSSAHTCLYPLVCHALYEEATRRGWFVVCPTGGVKQHYSAIEAQIKYEMVLDWILSLINGPSGTRIDTQRIYGIGFSMGGGAVMNYAARHADPREPMLAALINLSGGVSHLNTFIDNPSAKQALKFWFGDGTGELDPFRAQRSSLINYDPQTLQIDATQDVVRNLQHVPVHIQRYADDLDFIEEQSDLLFDHMQVALGHPQVSYDITPGTGHEWDVLSPVAALDFLEQYTLQIPTSGDTLADRDARYFYFDVFQDQPDAFTPFTWSIDGSTNTIALSATENLARVELDLADTSIDPAQPLHLVFGPSVNLGAADTIVLHNYPNPPLSVSRDSTPDLSWSFDDLANVLTLTELNGFTHIWEILPGAPAVVDPGLSTVVAVPATGVVANGKETSLITTTVRDAAGNPVVGQWVRLAVDGFNNKIVQSQVPTNTSGVVTGSLASTKSGVKTITAIANPTNSPVVLDSRPTISFIGNAETIDPLTSSATAFPNASVVADGVESSTITIVVRDVNSNPVAGQVVEITASGLNNTLTQPSGPTNSNGTVTATIASTVAEAKTITATVNPAGTPVVLAQTPTVEFIGDANNISGTLSSALASPATGVVADGASTSTITVTVLDVNGNPVPGQAVEIASDGSNDTITQPSGSTDAAGIATATIASTTAETKTITATVNPAGSPIQLTQTPTVEFIGDAENISDTLSGASASPATGVVADGTTTSTITVTVRDVNGNAVAGQTVEIASDGSNDTLTQPAGPTDANGVATATIASITAETKTVTATVDPAGTPITLTQTPTVEFIGDAENISDTLSSAVATPATGVLADGTTTSTITVTVRDVNGNPVSGQVVELAATGSNNTIQQPSGASDSNGVATGTIASTTPEIKTVTATVDPTGTPITLLQAPTVEFVP